MDVDIIEQKPISMVELKGKLDSIKKKNKELNFRAEKVYAYLEETTSEKKKDSQELAKKISNLGIQKLRDRQIVKILDVQPEDQDSLKAIFVGETSLKQEELKQILEAIND